MFVIAEASYPSLSLRYGQALSCRPWKLSLFQGHQSRSRLLKRGPLGLERAHDPVTFFVEGRFYCFQEWSRASLIDC